MAITFAKTTLAALEALLKRVLAEVVAPLQQEVASLRAQIAAMSAPVQQPPVATQPPVTTQPSGCVVTLTSVSGTTWRWDATAAARKDDLGLRALIEVPAEIAGCTSLRLVVDLGPGWADVVPRNDIAMRLGDGKAQFTISVSLDGATVLPQRNLTVEFGANEVLRLGQKPARTIPSTAELISKGLVARYAMGPVSDTKTAPWFKLMASDAWNAPGSSRGITTDMPQTGGRDDIGPTTAAQAAYLVSGDARILAYVVGQAEAAARIPWHLWDATTGSWLSAADYPKLWTDGRGGTGTPGDRNAGGLTVQLSREGWTIDSAHQPDLSFVPYLLTGERWMLDNLQAQAAWNVLDRYPNNAERGPDGLIVVDGGQVRQSAWSLRQIDEAAEASPEGSSEKAYFEKASVANWRWLVEQIPAWTASQGEAYGRVEGTYGAAGAFAPWQQDYFASTALAAARRGNADARKFLEWQSNFLVGRFEHLGHDGCAYLLPDDQKTWADTKAKLIAVNASNGDGWEHSQGDYALLARFTLIGIAEVLGDADAKKWADWLVAEKAPFTTPDDYMREPMLRV